MPDIRNVPLNKTFIVTVSVNYIGEPNDFIITDPHIETYHNMELIGTSTESLVKASTEVSNAREVIKNYIYTLQPKSLGQAYFPIVKIIISDKEENLINELSTQSIPITVTDPIVTRNYSNIFSTIIIILLILIGIFFIARYFMAIIQIYPF